jgi:hypothetical protein
MRYLQSCPIAEAKSNVILGMFSAHYRLCAGHITKQSAVSSESKEIDFGLQDLLKGIGWKWRCMLLPNHTVRPDSPGADTQNAKLCALTGSSPKIRRRSMVQVVTAIVSSPLTNFHLRLLCDGEAIYSCISPNISLSKEMTWRTTFMMLICI